MIASQVLSVHTGAAVVLGGTGPEALEASLGSLSTPPSRTWAAVATYEEADAVSGLATVARLHPWPGPTAALGELLSRLPDDVLEGAVLILAAGTVLEPGYLRQAVSLLEGGAAMVVGTDSDDGAAAASNGALLRRPGAWLAPEALLRPSSGMVMSGAALEHLVREGWLAGEGATLRDLRALGGVRVAKDAISAHRPKLTASDRAGRRLSVTVMIPAHNEQPWLGDTLRSLQTQTRAPDQVLVIDDCSTDRTGDIAGHFGASVLRTQSSSLKGGALNYGLRHVKTDCVLTIDADTALHPEAVERLVADLEAGNDATHGSVVPADGRGMWARARSIEYAVAPAITKKAQRSLGRILVLSGCVSAFRTDVLRQVGGFDQRTVVEDLDLTWNLHIQGFKLGYVPTAIAYTVEPNSWELYKKQMRRWAAGFVQTIGLHGWNMFKTPALGFMVVAYLLDYLALVPLLLLLGWAILQDSVSLPSGIILVLSMAWFGITVAVAASALGFRRAITSLPAYFVVTAFSQYFYLEAMVSHWVLRRNLCVWHKGH